jgi:hypothetical protein
MDKNPLMNPSDCPSLAHPGDHPALQQPTGLGGDFHRAPTEPGRDSEQSFVAELPSPEHDTPPRLEAKVTGFVEHASAMERVRELVVLPIMSDAYEGTRELHRRLRAAQNVVHVWADVGDARIGEIVHAANGIHATIMNVSSFAAQASELLDRATARPTEWAAAFEAIVSEAGKVKAYQLLAMASGALLAGPFTETWDNAVEWCLAFWDR